MKKFVLSLMTACAVLSCRISAEEWEKDFTGTWDLIGSATMNWHAIQDLSNWKLAKAIDDRLYERNVDVTLVFSNGRFEIINNDVHFPGRYSINDDSGAVLVDWEDGDTSRFWMYTVEDYLYSIEFTVDDSGKLKAEQQAHKFRRVSK